LFKKFHPRINLTTLFLTKTYILNTIKPFSGHKNWPIGLKQQNLKNLSEVATLRNIAHKAEAVGVTQICAIGGNGGGDGNGA
jgi:hypothetical protein